MKAFIILCALAAIAHGASVNRIVGGETAKLGQFKHQASLRYGGSHFCGATVIGRRTLATAAHCKVYPIEGTVAVLGTTKQYDDSARRYKIESFVIHEKYDAGTISNDVAVITLAEDIEFNDNVAAVSLAKSSPADGERLTSSGWGLTTYPGSIPNELQWMQMNVMSHNECTSITGQRPLTGKLCTLEVAGKGVCSGDSGGPLINSKNELVGITSAAYLCALGLPDFFTDVAYFRDWINDHTVA